MKVQKSSVTKLTVTEVDGLDPISIYIEDFAPGKGKITIGICGDSWSAGWGAMGGGTVSEFFVSCEEHYLAKNLSVMNSSVFDTEATKSYARNFVIISRKSKDISAEEARERFNKIDALEYETDYPLLSAIFGEEWWYSLQEVANPEYVYLCSVIKAVQKALATEIVPMTYKPEIRTIGKRRFNFIEPVASSVNIEDIAHALASVCRFNGHIEQHYSVAQHSVLTSYLVPPEDALAALLHDSTEAYLTDVTSPLKQLLPDYKAMELRIEKFVWGCFGLAAELPESVKIADKIMLATEMRDLTPDYDVGEDFYILPEGLSMLSETIVPWSMEQSRVEFLARFAELTANSM